MFNILTILLYLQYYCEQRVCIIKLIFYTNNFVFFIVYLHLLAFPVFIYTWSNYFSWG